MSDANFNNYLKMPRDGPQSLNDKNFNMMLSSKTNAPSTYTITKPISQYQTQERKKEDRDIVVDNSRQHRLKFTSKENLKKNKFLNFLSQE